MTRTRLTVLFLLLFCSGISFLFGFIQERSTPSPAVDFKLIYNGARCLLQQSDPYRASEFLRVYLADGGQLPSGPTGPQMFKDRTRFTYLPTVLIFIAPFATLPWGAAHAIWTVLTVGSLTLAAFLMWNLGADYVPNISFYLTCIVLGNSAILFTVGNPAGIAVSLCVVAVWCFLTERFVPAGILCLAVSLAIKPHDVGLVWLYFLLAGGVHRKRALQTLLVIVVLSLPAFLWVSHVAPHWMLELQSSLSTVSAHGGVNEPGPASVTGHTPGMVIDLQSVISVFWDDPRIYNPASYSVCGVLLFVWVLTTLKTRTSPASVWLALAAIAPLTMLPFYHRPYDAKLLLLSIPACAMLWAKGGLTGWLALVTTSAGIVFTGDSTLGILVKLTENLHVDTTGPFGRMLTVVLTQPVALILLAMSIFYLWIYVQRCSAESHGQDAASDGGSVLRVN